jgi:hypothetical protein
MPNIVLPTGGDADEVELEEESDNDEEGSE